MSHHVHPAFPVVGNCLQIGGAPVTRIAQRVGATPFFAYDRKLIAERVAQLRGQVPTAMALHYSVKANPMPALVQHMAGLVDGFDVASAGELKIVLDTGIDPARVSLTGPGKSEAELAQAVAAGVCINVESERDIRVLGRLCDTLGIGAACTMRVNPDFTLRRSGMRMGGGARQFGIDAEVAPAMLQLAGAAGIDIHGFHVFGGSQCLSAEAVIDSVRSTVELACRLADSVPSQVRRLIIGGGFGIPYFPGEQALDIARVGGQLHLLRRELTAALPGIQMAIELGRYLVGEAGVYVTRVVDRKMSRGELFLVTDGGMNHHLAASGNLGQLIRKNYPVAVGNRVEGEAPVPACVVGPLCTPLDLLAHRMDLGHAQVGDLIVIFQSGAYGPSASPSGFLSRPAAIEVLV